MPETSGQYQHEQILSKFKSRNIRAYIGDDNSSRFRKFLIKAIYVTGFPFRIITPPMIDACGKNAWDIMTRRTHTAFVKSYPYETSEKQEIKIAIS